MHFTDLDVPPGAIIENAFIEFVSVEAAASGVITIAADTATNSTGFDITDVFSSTTLTANENWTTAWAIDYTYQAPINDVVQAMTNLSTWNCGENIAFLVDSTNTQYKISTGSAPVLTIEYSLPAGVTDCSYTRRTSILSPVEKAISYLSVPAGSTAPLLEGITEAANYFLGEAVINGLTRHDNPFYFVSHPDTYISGTLSSTPDECHEVLESGEGNKTEICHVPPGNPENAHTIIVSGSAAATHLGHHDGDTAGSCGDAANSKSESCDSEEITNSPIYSCNGDERESTETITVCYDNNGTPTTADITLNTLANDATYADALPGECLQGYTIPTDAKKIDICHYPPGNTANVQAINISVNALKTHLSHHNDSIYDEEYGCNFDPTLIASANSTSCAMSGSNCLIVIAGPGQDTSNQTAVTNKIAYIATNNDTETTDDDISTMIVGVNVSAIIGQKPFLDAILGADNDAADTSTLTILESKLTESITQCFANSTQGDGPIFSASISKNRFDDNKSHHKEIYYAFTKPSDQDLWDGNLKKFYLVGGAVCATDTSPCVGDDNLFSGGYGALHTPYTSVLNLGAGALMTSSARNISAYVPNNVPTVVQTVALLADTATVDTELSSLLAGADNETNVKINNGMRGLDTFSTEPTQDRTWLLADMLHSPAQVVNYTKTDIGVLIATNDGFVHLFDGNSLAEKWAFAPDKLLSKQEQYIKNDCNGDAHSCYGVDSTVNVFITDADNQGVNGSDSVRAFFGLGYGGTGFYALDITNFTATAPTMKWYLDNNTSGFTQLGSVRAGPLNAVVDPSYCNGTNPCNVMLLSGGYDIAQNGGTHGFKFGTSATGKSVYMLDPLADSTSAAHIQGFADKSDNTDMTYAVVSAVKTLDANENDIIDTLYVSNVGGEVIRIHLKDSHQVESVHLVAQLSENGSTLDDLEVNERSFFAPVDVIEMSILNQDVNVMVALTGTRPAAAEGYPVQDKIYVFLEENTGTVTDASGVTVSNGIDTNTLHVVNRADSYERSIGVTCGSEAAVVDCDRLLEEDVHGWVMSLDEHEMGIGSAIILPDVPEAGMYSVSFNTYNTDTHQSRMYMLNLLNGDPVVAKTGGTFDLIAPITDNVTGNDGARYQDLSNKAVGGLQAIKHLDGTSELLTPDGVLTLPNSVGINYKISPSNWMQLY